MRQIASTSDFFLYAYAGDTVDAFVARSIVGFPTPEGRRNFAVLRDAVLIGGVCLGVHSAAEAVGYMGWYIDPEHRGMGHATEAAAVLVAWGFEALGLRRIIAYTDSRNTSSRRVMERLGMTRYRVDQGDRPAPGGPYDTVYYGLDARQHRGR